MAFSNSLRHQVVKISRSCFFKTTTRKLFKVSKLSRLHQRNCVWPSWTHCATKWSKFRVQVSSKQLHQNFSKLVNRLVYTEGAAYDLPDLIAPPRGQNLHGCFFKTTTPELFKVSQLSRLHQRHCVWPSRTHCTTKWSKFCIKASSKQLHQNFSKLVNRLVCTNGTESDLPELLVPPSGQNFAFKFLQINYTRTFQS